MTNMPVLDEIFEDDFGALPDIDLAGLPTYQWKDFAWDWKAETLTIDASKLSRTGFGVKKPFINPTTNVNEDLDPKTYPVLYGFKIKGENIEIVFAAPTNELAAEEKYYPVVLDSDAASMNFFTNNRAFTVILTREQ